MTQAQIFLHTCTNYFCLIVGRSVGSNPPACLPTLRAHPNSGMTLAMHSRFGNRTSQWCTAPRRTAEQNYTHLVF